MHFQICLFPFLFFPWLAAGTLFAIPWFIGAAFELETLGGTILFFIWGFLVAASSEAIHRFEKARKYSLPILLASIVTTGTAMIYGFAHNETTGFVCALGVAIIYAALHFIRPRGWLWAFALLDFIIAYFAFFNLPFIQKANIFFGYQLLGLSILFLLPDLFFKNDSQTNWFTARSHPNRHANLRRTFHALEPGRLHPSPRGTAQQRHHVRHIRALLHDLYDCTAQSDLRIPPRAVFSLDYSIYARTISMSMHGFPR